MEYHQLVAKRKACRRCQGLTNLAEGQCGRYDADHIGPWSLWQGTQQREDWRAVARWLNEHGGI